MKKYIFLLLISTFLHFDSACQTKKGNLVIVGGGLEQNNKDVFLELIALAGGPDRAKFSIIPAASGAPMESFDYFRNELISYHVKPENISLIKLAVVDDDSTKDVDESVWKDNGNNPEIIKIIENSSCIWFSGGDQLRITETLINKDGSESNALKAIRTKYENGAVLGGTSAGAAIMSERMIGSGTSISSLKFGIFTDEKYKDLPADSGVFLTKGLGFFKTGMIDQHFNQRARLARLIMVMFFSPKITMGYGIDENTALIFNGEKEEFRVLGTGGITIIDLKDAEMKTISGFPELKNIKISYLSSGDRFELKTGTIIPEPRKKLISGNEPYDEANIVQSDMLSGGKSDFYSIITQDLINNKGIEKIENINFIGNRMGFQVVLTKTAQTSGYYAEYPQEIENYTVINILMDVIPIQINWSPLNK